MLIEEKSLLRLKLFTPNNIFFFRVHFNHISKKKNNVCNCIKNRAVSIVIEDIFRQKLKKNVYQIHKLIKHGQFESWSIKNYNW